MSNAIHPATPKTVMINRFLYLNIFLKVTFLLNLSLFQTNPILSSKILLPASGVFCNNNLAGISCNVFLTTTVTVIKITIIATTDTIIAISQKKTVFSLIRLYVDAYAFVMNLGNNENPTGIPAIIPIIPAKSPYVR